MNVQDSQALFDDILRRELFLPLPIKKSFENGLKGSSILSAKELNEYLNIPLEEIYDQLEKNGSHSLFAIHKKDIEDIFRCDSLAENIIALTVRIKYGWGLPSEENLQGILNLIKDKQGLLEMGAGSGLWTGLLQARTDKNIIGCERNLRADTPRPCFAPIVEADIQDLMTLYPDYPVLIVWPDTNHAPTQVLEKLKEGNLLIMNGPIQHTASETFYKGLDDNFERLDSSLGISFSGGEYVGHHVLKKQTGIKNPDNYFFNIYQDQPHLKMMRKIKKFG